MAPVSYADVMMRPDYHEALRRTRIMTVLREFDPRLAGTPPLGLDVPASDLDILCHAPDPERFAAVVWAAYGDERNFAIRQWIAGDRPVIASFVAQGWLVEVFGQAKPVSEQNAWRHLLVERRLLRLGGAAFRAAVMADRAAGMKTEPAFATVLRLNGDPYQMLLDLESRDDMTLVHLLKAAGFTF